MKLATIKNKENAAGIALENGVVLLEQINKMFNMKWETHLFELLNSGHLDEFIDWYNDRGKKEIDSLPDMLIPYQEAEYGPLYLHPRKIWGIGLNYREHASDLNEKAPATEPASFIKPDTAIIGHHDTIEIPLQSNRTTAEAELGIIIGKECKNVSEEEAENVIAGYTTIIDMTAEDILEKNPRYLTRSKSFDTFFSFGPHLVTKDEISNVLALQVSTMINGKVHRKNSVANMTFRPMELVSFHSKVMKLLPGDIISTGTPGAVVIRDGDIVECRIDGFLDLKNTVKDLKK
ncbi:fumarylacetoacetate hydrolase family protein [Neobacillus drentensis]|uniref:fumarylacetoacetate hydrolase family protein n=1 Tax=Neobacillus drentensis TaxID=220684 RepID=UPI002FFFE9DB